MSLPPQDDGGSGGNGTHPLGKKGQNGQAIQSSFKRLELVGRGAYGAVYRGVHVTSGKAVALKVVNLDTPDDDVSEIQREVALLSQLRETTTKNVIKYWGCWLLGPELWIVMDFAEGGSVRTLMKAGPIMEKFVSVIVRESLTALSYLHKSGIIHRDIKAANILLTNNGDVLLCDFGVAATFVSSSVHSRRTTFVGTPYWMAPEVITQGKSYDQSADIWSLGITIYEMLTGNPPLADQEQMRAIMLIPKNKPPRLPQEGSFSSPLREFVSLCLNEEPKERPNADELSRSKWIKSAGKIPNSILKELIQNYTSWTKTGGMRMSLLGAEANDLNDAANRDSFMYDAHDTNDGWEFSSSFDGFETETGPAASPAPPRDHPLLRLFDTSDGENTAAAQPRHPNTSGTAQPQYNGAEVRPAPAPPGPAPERPPAKAFSMQESAASPAAPAPISASGAAALQESKAAFTGTGATPFRFGGGGGRVPPISQTQIEHQSQYSKERIEPETSECVRGETENANSSSYTGGAEGRRARDPAASTASGLSHSRKESTQSGRSVNVEGSSTHASRPRHERSESVSVYSHSPAHSEGSVPASATSDRRQGMVNPGFTGYGHNNYSQRSNSEYASFSEPYASNARSMAGTAPVPARSGQHNVPTSNNTFFDGTTLSASPATENSRSAAAASAAMPPPPQPGLGGKSIGIGARSRSGSRSRAWQSSELESNGEIGAPHVPPMPHPSTLARHLGLAGTVPSSVASKEVLAPESRLLNSPAIHQRRHHGGSDPTQLLARRQSQEGETPRIFDHSANAAEKGSEVHHFYTHRDDVLSDIRALDFAHLIQKDEVYLELDRTVEDLGKWLDILGTGLAQALGSH